MAFINSMDRGYRNLLEMRMEGITATIESLHLKSMRPTISLQLLFPNFLWPVGQRATQTKTPKLNIFLYSTI